MAVKELCAFQPCGSCVVFVGLFAGFGWSVDTWFVMCIPEAQDGGAVGVAWPLPSSPASSPLGI